MTKFIDLYRFNALIDKLLPHFQAMNIDFFVMGAFARDLAFSEKPDFNDNFRTQDVDLAIRVGHITEFQQLVNRLKETGEFRQISVDPIKFECDGVSEFDLLPFGDIENNQRDIFIPAPGQPFVLKVAGLKEVESHLLEYRLQNGGVVHYCPLEGIVLLKLLSWHIDPGRTKDKDDIYFICNAYFDYTGDEVYLNAYDLLNNYNTENMDYMNLVASHFLGRRIRQIIGTNQQILATLNERLKGLDGVFRALLDGINDEP